MNAKLKATLADFRKKLKLQAEMKAHDESMNKALKAARADRRKKLQAEMKALDEPMDRALKVAIEEAYRKYRADLEAVEGERTAIALRWKIFAKTIAYKRHYAPLYAEWHKLFKEYTALWDEEYKDP